MNDVKTERDEYAQALPDVTRNRDAVAGERKVKAGETAYLPPLASMCVITDASNGNQMISSTVSAEGRASYRKYLSLAYFYGATGRTVDGLTGLIFMKQAREEKHTALDYLNDNVNGMGDSIRYQSQQASIEAFISPQSGLLVDYPKAQQGISVADAEAQNLRPKILHYKFDDIINWYHEIINNELKLALVVLREKAVIKEDRFKIDSSGYNYRVLELIDGNYTSTLFDDGGETISESIEIKVNGETSKEIPFYFISTGAEGKSVINDLVDANYNHYRFFADYAAKEHASAFPVFFETGATSDNNNNVIGPGMKWENTNEAATFGVIQTESDGGSMRTYLADMEQRMAALGAEMLKPRIASAESAESKNLDQVAQNSTVANIAINVSEAYEKALSFCARWLGVDEEVTYKLNTEYMPVGANPQLITALLAAVQVGEISSQTFYENLQKADIADQKRTFEEEQALITVRDGGLE